MKTLATIAVIFSLFLASCSTTYDASAPYDEVYSAADQPVKGKTVTTTTTTTTTVQSQPVESSTTYEGDYYSPEYGEGEFDSAGYYDYEYSSRIKRFNEENPGFDYYNDYYTDNYYYTSDPYAMGSNIYGGCGYCGPSISLGFGFGYGYGYGMGYPYYDPFWGYPYYGWGYPYYGWGYPYYGYGYGYGGSYWHGYYDGYYDGYYGGGGYYPDPYPGNGGYYGPRGSRTGSSDGSNSAGMARGDARTGGASGDVKSLNEGISAGQLTRDMPATSGTGSSLERSDGAVVGGTQGRSTGREVSPAPVIAPETGGTAERSAIKPAFEKPAEQTRINPSSQGGNLERTAEGTTVSPSRRVQPEMKYEKPKTYTAPTARTTPSKQEYISPGTRERTGTGQEGGENTRKVYSTTPERRSVNSDSPSQNYSAPVRSGTKNSYSAPSTSGSRSYSTPAKSSGSSSGGSSTRSSGSYSGGGASRSSGGSYSGGSSGGGGSRSSGGSSGGGGSHSSGGGGSRSGGR